MKTSVFAACGLILALCTVSVWSCGGGWRPYEGMCYHFSNDSETYMDAKAVCETLGSWLVEIESMVENKYIEEQVMNFPKVYWIGMTDLEEEGRWVWMKSKTTPTFFNWVVGSPDNNKNNENCGIINPIGTWNDIPCAAQISYICEKQNDITGALG